ncbi:MAG TPA: UDP-N-acetylmuramate dehydrogenase [Candidimonas sp.]|nr:UDP-N-acetylmuramate dehydrogenase [Candidimonas sp.]
MLHISESDLTPLNTLGLQARARALLRYASVDQLPEIADAAARYDQLFVLGGGSNVVLAGELRCLVVKVESKGIRLVAESAGARVVEAQAGENWHGFVRTCVANGWNGLENLALIPGTVGAAPVQNIGAYGVELDQHFHSLTAWDMHEQRLVEMGASDCQFSYRNSFFKRAAPGRWLITALRFSLPVHWEPVLGYPDLQRHPLVQEAGAAIQARQIFDAVCDIRQRKLPDPAVLGNAGSFFKNPVVDAQAYAVLKAAHPGLPAHAQNGGGYKLAAGWLIEQAGWKGRRLGAVGMHDRQALVLVNHGGASAVDVLGLANAVRDDVAIKFGVRLEQEPVPVGLP